MPSSQHLDMRYRLNSKIVSNVVSGAILVLLKFNMSGEILNMNLSEHEPENVKCFTELGDEMENSPSRAVDINSSQHVAVE